MNKSIDHITKVGIKFQKRILHFNILVKLNVNKGKQESPPAWTQEAYRPPCSKCSEGGGVPTLDGGGYLPWTGKGYLPWTGKGTYLWQEGRATYLGQGRGTYLWLGGVPTLDRARGTYLGWGGTYLGLSPPTGCGQTDTCENSTFSSYYVRGR